MNIESPRKSEMKRIIELYEIYGSQDSVLVNPHENPFVLSVRDRNFEIMRQNDQLNTIQQNKLKREFIQISDDKQKYLV